MRRLLPYLFSGILLVPLTTLGQGGFSFIVEAGKASFKMTEMKQFQAEEVITLRSKHNVTPVIVYDFPGNWAIGGRAQYTWNRHQTGIRFNWVSTGGRVQYADYSGQLKSDKVLNAAPVDAYYLWSPVTFLSNFHVYCGIGIGFSRTTMQYSTHYELYEADVSVKEDSKWTSMQGFIEPQVKLEYRLPFGLMADISISYVAQFASSPQDKDGGIVVLETPLNKDQARPEWGGMRYRAGIGYFIQKKQKKE